MCEAQQHDRVGAADFSEFCFLEIQRKPVAAPAERLATGSPRGGQAIAILHPPHPRADLGAKACRVQISEPPSLGFGRPGNGGHHHAFPPSQQENQELSPSLFYGYSIQIVFRYAYILRFPYGFSKGLTVSCPFPQSILYLPSHCTI